MILSLLTLFWCTKHDDAIDSFNIACKGLPYPNQSYNFLYFKNVQEGYLFGTFSHSRKLKKEEIIHPEKTYEYTEEANIYKTVDGGSNLIKIDSFMNYSFYKNASFFENGIYIQKINTLEHFKNELLKFDVLDNTTEVLNFNFESFGYIWNTNDRIQISYLNNNNNSR